METDEEFVQGLRQVFDLCDELKYGYISVDQLRDIVRKHFGGGEEDIARLIRCLDPHGNGVVTFPDFRRGVQLAMQSAYGHTEDISCSRPESPAAKDPPAILTDESVDDMCRLDYSPLPYPIPAEDADSALATASDISRESHEYGDKRDASSPSLSDGEERFEYDGEPDDMDYNGRRPPKMKLDLSSDSFRSTSSIDSATSGRRRRHQYFRRLSPSRLSAQAQAKNMRNGLSPRSSRRSSLSYDSDDRCMDQLSPEDEVDLGQKVEELEVQVSALRENQCSNDDRYTKVKQENAVLMSKIHSLEEQIRELEFRSEEQIKEKEKRLKDVMTRQEREKNMEKEQLYNLQQENLQLKGETIQLNLHIDKLNEEKRQLQEQLLDNRNELANLQEEYQRLKEIARREREEFVQQRNSTEKLLQELHSEVEELRQYKQEAEVTIRARSPSLLELPSQYRELEEELRKVKKENQELIELNETQSQMLNSSFQEGKTLLHIDSSTSLKEEFDTCSKDEVLKALKEQEEVNLKLKAYIDGILLNILENHPQLLER